MVTWLSPFVFLYTCIKTSSLGEPEYRPKRVGENFVNKYITYIEVTFLVIYRGADKSLARPGRKQATATEDFEFHISYL
jgi:hypothetical protein